MLERLLGSDQPFRRQPFRSKNSKKRPDFREKSPKTGFVLSDVPKSGSAEVRRPVYICVRSKPETRELAVFLRRGITTTLAPRRRMRTALVDKSVLALAPAQTGSRLAGLGPTDGCATAF